MRRSGTADMSSSSLRRRYFYFVETEGTIIGLGEGREVVSVMYSSFLGIAHRLGAHIVPKDGN